MKNEAGFVFRKWENRTPYYTLIKIDKNKYVY